MLTHFQALHMLTSEPIKYPTTVKYKIQLVLERSQRKVFAEHCKWFPEYYKIEPSTSKDYLFKAKI